MSIVASKSPRNIMFLEQDVPPVIWEEAQELNNKIQALQERIVGVQDVCEHDWTPVRHNDPSYTPRLDGLHDGRYDVIKEFRCHKCYLTKPLGGRCHTICRLCGGKMKYDRVEQFGMDRAHVYKCEDCDHEYDII